MKVDNRTYLGEVKVRSFEIDKYDTYFFETDKLNCLAETAKIRKLCIVCLNFFKTEEVNKWNYTIFNMSSPNP